MNPSVPTLEQLLADHHKTFWLTAPTGERVAAELHTATSGVPLNERYCCYSALFALPPGVQAAQAVYAVQSEADTWSLLLTPVAPRSDGRALLEAVFHYPIPQVSAGQTHT